jgi:hypothetical protein
MKWLGSYAAYSKNVLRMFFEEINRAKPGSRFFDPMCGTGILLVEGKRKGIAIDGFDINQIQVIQCRAKLINLSNDDFDTYYKEAKSLECKEMYGLIVSEDWYHESVARNLIDFRKSLIEHSMNLSPDHYHLAEAAFALTLRKNSCYGISSNPTWLKRGGTLTGTKIKEEYLEAIGFIKEWHNNNYFNTSQLTNNSVNIRSVLCESQGMAYDICLTSPPYCNRLDYKRMFGPEHFFYSRYVNNEEEPNFMGNNVIRGYVVDEESHSQFELDLLDRIRSRQDPKNNNYYYKYYSKYFKELKATLHNIELQINKNGYMLVNVQNSTYKGVEICIDDIIINHFGPDRAECIYDEHKSHFGNIVQAKTKQKETIIKVRS